jgi:hypothetical protein
LILIGLVTSPDASNQKSCISSIAPLPEYSDYANDPDRTALLGDDLDSGEEIIRMVLPPDGCGAEVAPSGFT